MPASPNIPAADYGERAQELRVHRRGRD